MGCLFKTETRPARRMNRTAVRAYAVRTYGPIAFDGTGYAIVQAQVNRGKRAKLNHALTILYENHVGNAAINTIDDEVKLFLNCKHLLTRNSDGRTNLLSSLEFSPIVRSSGNRLYVRINSR